jgi:hypothetical protein
LPFQIIEIDEFHLPGSSGQGARRTGLGQPLMVVVVVLANTPTPLGSTPTANGSG